MGDIHIRRTGQAGRITFTRPAALNAMTYDMCLAIDAALRDWQHDDRVQMVVIDATGDKAFCAGGDIAELYATGMAGDFAYGRRFWRDEYRLNARIAEYAKPVISFMQGFVMGGGVGIGCHAAIRVVDDTSRIAMPECGIGLVPDVGGSYLLARAPGHLGSYLGLTGARMGADDAILAGFADTYIPRATWPGLIARLEQTGDSACIAESTKQPPSGAMRRGRDEIDHLFAHASLDAIGATLRAGGGEIAGFARKAFERNSPLSMACTAKIIQTLRDGPLNIRRALTLEYRFTYRAMQKGDFLEGIRAQIVDKDRKPVWKYQDTGVAPPVIADMLAPLGDAELTF